MLIINKKGRWYLWVSIVLVIILIVMAFYYFALYKPSHRSPVVVQNPIIGMNSTQAVDNFNESYVLYLLASIKAYNLHNPPLSSDKPKIEVLVGSEAFNAVVNNGNIIVSRGNIDGKDAIITTTREEIVKMIENKDYVRESFASGNSGIELVAGKTLLFAKGYLNLYTEVTGKSITGNIIRIYTN